MNTNTDLVWSELSQQMISKSELDEFAKAWTAQTAWADDFDFEETSPIVRRQSSWSDIMKRERVGEIKKEVKTSKREEEEGEEVVKDLDCAICFDCFTPKDACSTTPCGHKFHSACLFRNFEHRPECPLCRTELIKQPEEVDDDDDDEDDDDDDDDETEDGTETPTQIVSIKQMADKLSELGYTIEDILMLHFGGSDHPKDIANPRWHSDLATATHSSVGSHILEYNEEEQKFYPEPKSILLRLNSDIDNIIEGNIAVNYKDSRTYAQVAASPQQVANPQQVASQ